MVLKGYMHDNPTSERLWSVRMHSGQGAFRGQFTVCLFIVLLAVFGWVIHRRLTQYDTPQQAIHQSTAIKACVPKRNPISVPSLQGADAIAVFLLAFAFTAIRKSSEKSKTAVAFRVQREQSDQQTDAGMRPCLNHFFHLPPPLLLSEL